MSNIEMNGLKMKHISGKKAYEIFKDGGDVYSKIFDVKWTKVNEKWTYDDFMQGHFNFFIEDKSND